MEFSETFNAVVGLQGYIHKDKLAETGSRSVYPEE